MEMSQFSWVGVYPAIFNNRIRRWDKSHPTDRACRDGSGGRRRTLTPPSPGVPGEGVRRSNLERSMTYRVSRWSGILGAVCAALVVARDARAAEAGAAVVREAPKVPAVSTDKSV